MPTRIINLTPHPVTVYPAATADRIEPGTATPIRVIPASTGHAPARLGQRVIADSQFHIDGIAAERVQFGTDPGCASTLPEPADDTWYLVALVVAVAATHRHDLLVVHDYVRDTDGCIIGCRKLASPQR